MHLSKDSTGIFDIYKALRESPIRVIEVPECMWYAGVSLHRDLVSSPLHELTIILSFISLKIKLCCDDVGLRKIFE